MPSSIYHANQKSYVGSPAYEHHHRCGGECHRRWDEHVALCHSSFNIAHRCTSVTHVALSLPPSTGEHRGHSGHFVRGLSYTFAAWAICLAARRQVFGLNWQKRTWISGHLGRGVGGRKGTPALRFLRRGSCPRAWVHFLLSIPLSIRPEPAWPLAKQKPPQQPNERPSFCQTHRPR